MDVYCMWVQRNKKKPPVKKENIYHYNLYDTINKNMSSLPPAPPISDEGEN